jgi:hypothetical protein
MADELDEILDSLDDPNDTTVVEDDTGVKEDDVVEDEEDPSLEDDVDTDNDDESNDDNQEEKDVDTQEKDEDKDTNPMRQLRNNYKQVKAEKKTYEDAISKLAKQQGVSPDDLISKLQEESDEKEAKSKGISPEIQKQMREDQERIKNLEEENNRGQFVRKLSELQGDTKLDRTGLEQFIKDASARGFDLMTDANVNFSDLYFAMNRDQIINQRVEQERQKWLANQEKRKKKNPGNSEIGGSGNTNSGKKGDLNSALDEVAKNLGI